MWTIVGFPWFSEGNNLALLGYIYLLHVSSTLNLCFFNEHNIQIQRKKGTEDEFVLLWCCFAQKFQSKIKRKREKKEIVIPNMVECYFFIIDSAASIELAPKENTISTNCKKNFHVISIHFCRDGFFFLLLLRFGMLLSFMVNCLSNMKKMWRHQATAKH